jgi:peptidoglycan/xylan/chitin deacetylase (PgdA/CDA1 family)
MAPISIIIGIRNEINSVAEYLAALQQQTLPTSDFEVIFVANRPSVPARQLISRYAKSMQLALIETDSPNPGGAFNCGANAASGEFFVFLEESFMPDRRLAEGHLQAQQACGGGIVIGEARRDYTGNAKGFIRYLVEQENKLYKPIRDMETISWTRCKTGNLSMPRGIFLRIGGFDDSLPDFVDVEICFRLAQTKIPIAYSREASGRRKVTTRLREIVLEIQKQAKVEVSMYQRHPSMLPQLSLGKFNDLGMRGSILRRLWFTLGIHPILLAALNYIPAKQSQLREWYRFFYSYCYWYGVRLAVQNETWNSLTRGPIILMYHAVGQPHQPAGKYILPERQFKRQMAWLRKRDYRVISLENLISLRRENRLPPGRSVIITFDDGYKDNWEIAAHILRHYGFTATIFLVSRYVGKTNQWDREGELAGRQLLSWKEIQKMRQEGFSFGAHSRSHTYLTELAEGELKSEIEGSSSDLQNQSGQPVTIFAYPNGKFNQEVIAALKNAGFLAACSSDSGVNDPAIPEYALRRAEIRGNYSLVHFASTLWLGQTRAFWRLLKGI